MSQSETPEPSQPTVTPPSTIEPLPVEPELPAPTVARAAPDVTEPLPPAPLSPAVPPPYMRLFLISFFILFLELACIRWFGSTVVFLTFFTNIVLIACFLGMSVGCLAATRRFDFIRLTLPVLGIGILLSAGLLRLHQERPDLIFIDVGNQRSPANIYFGTEYGNPDLARAVIPIEVIAGTFFVLIAFTFIGLGQEMGRAFDRLPNRVGAYTTNVVGSLLGIAVFSAMSYAWTPPLMWFAIALVLMAYFMQGRWSGLQTVATVAILLVSGVTSYYGGFGSSVLWSPYYKITYDVKRRSIDTNNISHQHMEDLTDDSHVYTFTYGLNRDAGNDPYEHVMVIGAGSGNDVTAALMNGAKTLDAVEIDPAIQTIGAEDHPNRPYKDPRFIYYETLPDGRQARRRSIIHQDGRQWLKQNINGMERKDPRHRPYDLAVYALVDSLVLHSSYSGSLRLESFLFTKEAFEDVKKNLKPGGVFAMYNSYRQPWVVGRLYAMAKEVFGVEPLVFAMPMTPEITDDTKVRKSLTFLYVGVPDAGSTTNRRLENMRSKLKDNGGSYYHSSVDAVAKRVNGYSATPPTIPPSTQPSEQLDAARSYFFHFKPAVVDVKNFQPVPTDNWPQLYLKEPKISPEVRRSMMVIGGLSAVILLAFMPKGRGAGLPSGRMFFLGAGFMLLETKGVVHMSLLFGSTWITNSVVFFAILVMILLSNLFVLAVKPRKLWPYYVLLGVALVVNALVPMNRFLSIADPTMRTVVSCCVIFVPIFFAGVIFGASFRDSIRPDADFGWNIAGVILGALAENFSMMLGFNYLIFIALGFYLLSMPFGRRKIEAAPSNASFSPA